MPNGTLPIPADALEVLDAYRMSEDAPENSIGLSDLDGFLTGLAVGPEQIMPSEWLLPLLVLGSDDERPLFDAVPLPEDQAERLLENGADILMAIIPAIYEFWQERIT